jgi:NtrC-family two-component system sensor histidine kinase KinB
MGNSLRQLILITLLPLLVLVAVMGSAGVLLLHQLGDIIDVILRENYESVVAMQDLKEALERIDSSFQFMVMAQGLNDGGVRKAKEQEARQDFDKNWELYKSALLREENNITIHPAEDKLVKDLQSLTANYHKLGLQFFEKAAQKGPLHQDYDPHLYSLFGRIKKDADDILGPGCS